MTQALATVDHSSREHARFSPSSFKYRELCPFWDNEDEEGKDTSFADRGTAMHEACETGDLSALEEHEKDLVNLCLGYVGTLKKQMGGGHSEEKELKVPVLDQFGSFDLLLHKGDKAKLVDFKFVFHAVDPAETNAQMQGYCLGIWDKYPEIEEIEVHIPMPRLGQISTHTYTRAADYERIRWRISTIIERAKNPGAYNPSPVACEYCGSRGKCQALADAALLISYRGGLDIPQHTGPLTITNPTDMNKLLKVAPLLEKWAKDIKQAALDMHLDEGWEYDDFKLATRSTNRTVTSALAAWDALKDEVSQEDFISACGSVSVVELEKVFSAKAPRGKKASEAARLENLLRDAGALKEQGEITYLKQVKNKTK